MEQREHRISRQQRLWMMIPRPTVTLTLDAATIDEATTDVATFTATLSNASMRM